eukprot:768407-Hanusia_phi.AAC.4
MPRSRSSEMISLQCQCILTICLQTATPTEDAAASIGTIGGINPLAAAAAAQATLLASQVHTVNHPHGLVLTGCSQASGAVVENLCQHLPVSAHESAAADHQRDDKVGALVEFRTVREAQNARQNLGGLKYGDKSLQGDRSSSAWNRRNVFPVEWPPDYSPLTDEQMKGCIGTGILGLDGEIELALGGGKTNAAVGAGGSVEWSKPKESEATKVDYHQLQLPAVTRSLPGCRPVQLAERGRASRRAGEAVCYVRSEQ